MEFNSLILEAVEKFERIFIKLGENDSMDMSYFIEVDLKRNKKIYIGTLSFEDWKNVRSMVKFLKIFYMDTLKIFYSLYVISNSFSNEFIYMHTNISQMCRNKDNLSCRMRKNMMLKYEKYYKDKKK